MENKLISEIIKSLEKSLGEEYNKEYAERFAAYCYRIKNETKANSDALRNPWMQHKTVDQLDGLYRRVLMDGLIFDGVHITLQSTGVSYDYVAYKNKMLLAYPESLIDIQIVYKDDGFSFSKESGSVIYSHSFNDPFKQDDNLIIGTYCVIKNKRGEFITLLSKEEIDKHRKVAKTDFIWKAWFKEMVMKTIIKKACKYHFQDIYEGVEELDNENYDLNNIKDWDRITYAESLLRTSSYDDDTKDVISIKIKDASMAELDEIINNLKESQGEDDNPSQKAIREMVEDAVTDESK